MRDYSVSQDENPREQERSEADDESEIYDDQNQRYHENNPFQLRQGLDQSQQSSSTNPELDSA